MRRQSTSVHLGLLLAVALAVPARASAVTLVTSNTIPESDHRVQHTERAREWRTMIDALTAAGYVQDVGTTAGVEGITSSQMTAFGVSTTLHNSSLQRNACVQYVEGFDDNMQWFSGYEYSIVYQQDGVQFQETYTWDSPPAIPGQPSPMRIVRVWNNYANCVMSGLLGTALGTAVASWLGGPTAATVTFGVGAAGTYWNCGTAAWSAYRAGGP